MLMLCTVVLIVVMVPFVGTFLGTVTPMPQDLKLIERRRDLIVMVVPVLYLLPKHLSSANHYVRCCIHSAPCVTGPARTCGFVAPQQQADDSAQSRLSRM